MKEIQKEKNIELALVNYLEKFEYLYKKVINDYSYIGKLEILIDEYSEFILDERYKDAYSRWNDVAEKSLISMTLADMTSKCVKQVENIRARRLLDGKVSTSGYFDNIEHCINEEFGQFEIHSNDKVLLIGSGAYPMTLVQIAEETNAQVIGIDIDQDALIFGKAVVKRLAPDKDIRITNQSVSELEDISEVTHIIFSSTVPMKYEILDELYQLTNKDVVVAMRYGNGFKSIFNYPKINVNPEKWECIQTCIQDNQIFDIALYRKANKGEVRQHE